MIQINNNMIFSFHFVDTNQTQKQIGKKRFHSLNSILDFVSTIEWLESERNRDNGFGRLIDQFSNSLEFFSCCAQK